MWLSDSCILYVTITILQVRRDNLHYEGEPGFPLLWSLVHDGPSCSGLLARDRLVQGQRDERSLSGYGHLNLDPWDPHVSFTVFRSNAQW